MVVTATPETAPDESTPRRFRAPSRSQLVAMVVALCFLSGVIGWKIGQGGAASKDSADVGFLFDMISHHEQAILMASTELFNGRDHGVEVFAEEIHRFQSYEIGLMERHLDRLGYTRYQVPDQAMAWMGEPVARDAMPGLASEAEMDGLSEAGADTDAWFVTLMIDHHAGGAVMAEAAAEQADDPAVRELAERMAKAQRYEIGEMLGAAERAGIDVPVPGATWDVYGVETSGHHGG